MLGRAVKEADAAMFQFGGVFGVENQIPFVFRPFIAQSGFHFGFVNRQGVDAPEIRYGVFVAGINLLHLFEQFRIDIAVIRDFAFIDFPIGTGLDLAADVGDGGGNQVVAGIAGQQFGFQGFVAVVEIVAYLNAFGRFECGNSVRIDVIRPVENIEFFCGGRLFVCGSIRAAGCLVGTAAGCKQQGAQHECR